MLSLYGLHRLTLVATCLLRERPRPSGRVAPAAADWPVVTVQLPVFNEYYVVERLIGAACALAYPAGRLEIQVLDDSTDETAGLAARLVASYRARGHDIHYMRRGSRAGYKAGALAFGLGRARGEMIAVFDADFVPPPDFLQRAVAPFLSPGRGAPLGMVQARWGHLNRDVSLLTRAQALLLDGHFIVEHAARQASGRFLNFNGTAGVFRRRCIEEAGGWHDDTLTEDLDLSYRAQLAGWRFAYLDDLVVPAELPVDINSLKSQQRRWAMGSIQTAAKLLPRVLRSKAPPGVKIEAVAHLTNNLAYLLLAALAVLIVPALMARGDHPWTYLMLDLPLFALGTGSFALYCGVAQRASRRDWLLALAAVPMTMAIGVGLCVNNGLAVIEALAGRRSAFERTPKFGTGGPTAPEGGGSRRPAYRGRGSALVLVEAALAVYFSVAIIAGAAAGWLAPLPFLLLFAGGFAYVTLLTASQYLARRFPSWSSRPAEAPAP